MARIELQDLLQNEEARLDDIEEKIRDIHSLEADLQIENVKSDIEARNVLTPEQREQIGTHRQGMIPRQESGIRQNMMRPGT